MFVNPMAVSCDSWCEYRLARELSTAGDDTDVVYDVLAGEAYADDVAGEVGAATITGPLRLRPPPLSCGGENVRAMCQERHSPRKSAYVRELAE